MAESIRKRLLGSQLKLDEKQILILLLLAAALFRLPLLTTGLPYIQIDEGHVLHRSIHMLRDDTWDAGWYRYPTLMANLIAFFASCLEWLGFSQTITVEENIYYSDVGPTTLIVIGRIIVATVSILTPVFVFKTVRQLGVSVWASLGAGLLAALVPAFVGRSYFIITDVLSTFFVVTCLYYCAKILIKPNWRWTVMAGACAGFAFASKYPGGGIALSVGVAILISYHKNILAFLKQGFLSAAAFSIATFIAMPQWLLKHEAVLLDIEKQAKIYARKVSASPYWEVALSSKELGWAFVIAVLTGLVFGLIHKTYRLFVLICAPFLFVAIYLALSYDFHPFRNMLPVIAIAIIMFAFALEGLRKLELSKFPIWLSGKSISIVLGVTFLGVMGIQSFNIQYKVMNTAWSRIDTVKWLYSEFRENYSVLVSKDLGFSKEHVARSAKRFSLCTQDELQMCVNTNEPFDVLLISNAARQELEKNGELKSYDFVKKYGRLDSRVDRPHTWVHQEVAVNIFRLKEVAEKNTD